MLAQSEGSAGTFPSSWKYPFAGNIADWAHTGRTIPHMPPPIPIQSKICTFKT